MNRNKVVKLSKKEIDRFLDPKLWKIFDAWSINLEWFEVNSEVIHKEYPGTIVGVLDQAIIFSVTGLEDYKKEIAKLDNNPNRSHLYTRYVQKQGEIFILRAQIASFLFARH